MTNPCSVTTTTAVIIVITITTTNFIFILSTTYRGKGRGLGRRRNAGAACCGLLRLVAACCGLYGGATRGPGPAPWNGSARSCAHVRACSPYCALVAACCGLLRLVAACCGLLRQPILRPRTRTRATTRTRPGSSRTGRAGQCGGGSVY